MCIAVAAKVLSIDSIKNIAKVDINGNRLDVNIGLINPKEGDFVLIHAGCAIEIVREETATEIMDLFSLLEDSFNEND